MNQVLLVQSMIVVLSSTAVSWEQVMLVATGKARKSLRTPQSLRLRLIQAWI